MSGKLFGLDQEYEICKRYEAILAAIAVLDRAYYMNNAPTGVDRAPHVVRPQELETVRNQFYSELEAIRHRLPGTRPN